VRVRELRSEDERSSHGEEESGTVHYVMAAKSPEDRAWQSAVVGYSY
jgi:hypothetical protein